MWPSIATFITAKLVPLLVPILGSTLAGLAVAWVLGKFTDSNLGSSLLAKAMRQSRRAGRAMSALGEGKLGALWNPIELFGTTWGRSIVDEFFVGLREDNVEKLGEEAERLEKAGSVARVKAIREKIEEALANPQPPKSLSDAEVMARAVAAGEAGTQDRLLQ